MFRLPTETFSVSFDIIAWGFILVFCCIVYYILFPLRYSFVVAKPIIYLSEVLYKFLIGLFKSTNSSYTLHFFSLIVTLFYFILFSNLLGLLPYGFTLTSQLYLTFACAISLFIGITLIGMYLNKFNFIKFFIPSSVANKPLRIFLVFIEVLSYVIRPFSLGIRLFANMLAGHTLIFILANFSYSIA